MSPTFNKNTLIYNITVPNNVTSVTISVTTEHDKASYSISGGSSLVVGNNTATVLVTAEDGSTRTYTININREAAPEPEPEPNPEPEKPDVDGPVVPDAGDNDNNGDHDGNTDDNNGDGATPEVKPDVENKPVETPDIKGDGGLSTVAKVSIGVFVPLGVIIVVLFVFLFLKRR